VNTLTVYRRTRSIQSYLTHQSHQTPPIPSNCALTLKHAQEEPDGTSARKVLRHSIQRRKDTPAEHEYWHDPRRTEAANEIATEESEGCKGHVLSGQDGIVLVSVKTDIFVETVCLEKMTQVSVVVAGKGRPRVVSRSYYLRIPKIASIEGREEVHAERCWQYSLEYMSAWASCNSL